MSTFKTIHSKYQHHGIHVHVVLPEHPNPFRFNRFNRFRGSKSHAEPAQQPGGSQRSHRRRPWTASRATSIGAEKRRLRGVRCGAKGVFQGETDLACSPQWLVLGRRRSSEKKLKNVGGGGGKLYVRL